MSACLTKTCLLVSFWSMACSMEFHPIPASKQAAESVWHIPDAVCTVLDSWRWTERPSETCRVLLQNKINLRNWCTSRWFYYRNIVDEYCEFRCRVTWGSGSIWAWNVTSCSVIEVYRRFENSAAYIVCPLKRLYTCTIKRHISEDLLSNLKAGLLKICSFMFVRFVCNCRNWLYPCE